MQKRHAIWWKERWKYTQKGRRSLSSLVPGILWPYPEDSVALGMCLLPSINTINSSHLRPRHPLPRLLHRSQASNVPDVFLLPRSKWSINLFFWVWLWLASAVEILLSPSSSSSSYKILFYYLDGWCYKVSWSKKGETISQLMHALFKPIFFCGS